MTSALDRQDIVALIDEATAAGARQSAACAELNLSARTLQRWKDTEGGIREDRRPFAERPAPANRLSEEERDLIVVTCAAPEFASLPPSQIVPRLADRGTWIVSESSFYRVLRKRGQNHRRGRARPTIRRKPPTSFEAKASGPASMCPTGRPEASPPSRRRGFGFRASFTGTTWSIVTAPSAS